MLRFTLKFGNKLEAIINAAHEEGDEIPESIRNAPVLNPEYEFYWRCFTDLSTDRPQTMGGIGPIPWSSIYNYCKAYDVCEYISDISEIIQKVDKVYLEILSKNMEAKVNKVKKQSNGKV